MSTLTPSETLKAAAAKIRELAREAEEGPICAEYAHWAIRHVERNVSADDLDLQCAHAEGDICHGFGMYAGRYFALWHRSNGELIATLLESWTDVFDQIEAIGRKHGRGAVVLNEGQEAALALARSILGEDVTA